MLSKSWPKLYASNCLKLLLAVGVVLLVIKCDQRMRFRYSTDDWYYYSSMKTINMYDIEPYLEELGIDRSARVYCTPDPSINISLYLCSRKGRTDFTKLEILPFAERVEDMRKTGIEYLILGSREAYNDVENLDEILGEKIGQTGTTEIFKLNPDE